MPVIEPQTVGTLVFNRFYQFLWFVLVAHPAVFCFILLMGIEYTIISNPFSCRHWISINLKQFAFSTVCSYCELSCYELSYTSHLCMYVYVYLFLFLLGRYLEVVLLRGKHMFMKNCQLIPQMITFMLSLAMCESSSSSRSLPTVGILSLNCILLGVYSRTATV